MSASQFTVYSSSDPGNGSDQPGLLFGAAGDLLRILDKCLVNGYTGKAAAGWTKPFANASNSGCYKNSTLGTGFALHVQDNGGNVTSTFREAWITGWENITAVNATVGAGTGQFPTPAQSNTTGLQVVRKSTTADSTNGRAWVCFADAYTFYFFCLTGDIANVYHGFGFGDLYSFKGSTDSYRAFIYGRNTQNSGLADALAGDWDAQSSYAVTAANVFGQWTARTFGGGGSSIQTIRIGDGSVGLATGSSSSAMAGLIPTPNAVDNSYYLSQVRVAEMSPLFLRGRMRGVYQLCHPKANFADGQTFQGSGDFAGKSFYVILTGGKNGMWAIETSATVETN